MGAALNEPRAGAFYGRAVFATTNGLFAAGDGLLSFLHRCPEVVEFRRTERGESLAPQQGEEVYFRLLVATGDPSPIALVGVSTWASDFGRREGYMGSCVAVRPADCETYAAAIDAARDLILRLRELGEHGIGMEDGYRLASNEGFRAKVGLEPAPRSVASSLRRLASEPALLIQPEEVWPDHKAFAVRALSAGARLSQNARRPLFVFMNRRERAELISTNEIIKWESGAAALQPAPTQPEARSAVDAPTESPSEMPSRSDFETLARRITELERYVKRLEDAHFALKDSITSHRLVSTRETRSVERPTFSLLSWISEYELREIILLGLVVVILIVCGFAFGISITRWVTSEQ